MANKQLESFTLEQLKSKAFDLIVRIRAEEQTLNILQQEIFERQNVPQSTIIKEKVETKEE
jgi:hypothetical protein